MRKPTFGRLISRLLLLLIPFFVSLNMMAQGNLPVKGVKDSIARESPDSIYSGTSDYQVQQGPAVKVNKRNIIPVKTAVSFQHDKSPQGIAGNDRADIYRVPVLR